MTTIRGACIVVALVVPALCGLSHMCIDGLKEVIAEFQ